MRTCTTCGAPDPVHDVIDDDGSKATCSLCLLVLVGNSGRHAVALTVMVTATELAH